MIKTDFRSYRIKSPVKSFRDLEVYQKTVQLSDEITSLSFLGKEQFEDDNKEIKNIAEKIPKLIAEAYGDKFDSKELANKKLTEAVTLMTNAVTKIDLLRQRFAEGKEPAPAPAVSSQSPMPTLSAFNEASGLASSRALYPAAIDGAGAVSPDINRKSSKEILDNLLIRYQTQKIKVLNLRKAWNRVFTNYTQNEPGKAVWRK